MSRMCKRSYVIKKRNCMKNDIYITYEEPFTGSRFSPEQMEIVYKKMVNKKEYPDFNIWIKDMLRSGVFEWFGS